MRRKVSSEPNAKEDHTNWYDLYFPMIRKLITEHGGSIQDVEDVFQETLIVVIEKKRNNAIQFNCKRVNLYICYSSKYMERLYKKRKKTYKILMKQELGKMNLKRKVYTVLKKKNILES